MNIMRKVTRYLFFLTMVDKICNRLANDSGDSEQCDTFITVNSSKFDGEGSLGNITFWDSDGNLHIDESFHDNDTHCFDSEKCYHLFLYGSDDFRVFQNDALVEEGQVHEDGLLYRVGSCSKKPKCKTGYELFIFAIDDYSFSLKSSEGIVDQGHIADREAQVYCLDSTDCYELRGTGNGYYSESVNNRVSDQGDAKYKRFGSCASKCDEKPLLTESDRGRDITIMLGTMSGMESISDVDSAEYKAACWIIHDDQLQIQSSNFAVVQRYVLALLYYATDGPKWDNDHNFLGPLNECQWHNAFNQGVFCNDHGNVTEIKLVFNNMKGTIITEINRLTKLEQFKITGSSLSGSIPIQLGSLKHLSKLDLSYNLISGSLLVLSKMKLLKEVFLTHNKITGPIPSLMGNIEILSIDNNFLNGTISFENIGTLTKLKKITLISNMLSGIIPSSVGNLTDLEIFNLHRNNLSGTIPSNLFLLPLLKFIDISRNRLTGGIPEPTNSKSMEFLDLSDQQLNGTIPSTISTLSHLKFLDLSNNSISGQLSQDLSNLQHLATLKIQGNSITGIVPFENCMENRTLEADCDTPKDVVCNCCRRCTGFYTNPPQDLGCTGKELGLRFFNIQVNDDIYFDLENDAKQYQLQGDYDAKSSINATFGTCVSATDCFRFKSRSDAPFVILRDNMEISRGYKTFVDVNAGYSRKTNSLEFNVCDEFVLCDKVVEPHTPKRALVNLLTRFTDIATLKNTSSFQNKAACWWLKDLEQRSSDDLKDTALIQRYLLSLLYFSTGGESWSNNELWLTRRPTCNWHGIACFKNQIINGIKLMDNNLNGNLPTEIGQLIGLEYLDLSMNNHLSGSIPKQIKYLKALKELKCNNCHLSHTIPTEISFLTELIKLDLTNNIISGQIPLELAHVEKLVSLKASYNNFYGTLPDISSLVHLRELNLGENFLQGNCESIKELFNLEYLDLRDNFFDDELPISPRNHKKLKIIHLERNKFAGVLPTDMRFLEALEELWLYDNRLSSYIPSGIGELTNLTSLSLSYNDIRGSMPEDIVKLNKLEHLQLHHNRLNGNAVNFEGNVKDYVTDCGATVSDAALVACEDCSICCNIDGDCIDTSSTYPSDWLSSVFERYPNTAYIPFLGIMLACILIFLICIAISRSKLGNKLPCIPFEVRSEFQKDSVYKFLLAGDKVGWFVALFSGAVHIMVVMLFIRSSNFSGGASDTEYAFTCSRYNSDCESDNVIDSSGWFIFVTLIFVFLFKDLVDGIMMAYEGVTRCDIKGSFAGTFVFGLTTSSAAISYIYNHSTGISNSDIIKDAAILLFLNEIDDQLLSILKRIFPSWVEKIEDEISSADEIVSTGPNNADDRKSRTKTPNSSKMSQSSIACTNQQLALELNANQMPDTLISSDHRNLVASNDMRLPPSQVKGASNFELMSKINEITQRIDALQTEVNRLASQYFGAVDVGKQLSKPDKKNYDAVINKIVDVQQEINSLKRELSGINLKLEGRSDLRIAGQNVIGTRSEF